jgi:hypothetical protein
MTFMRVFLAATLLCSGIMRADTVTVLLGPSNENYTLYGTGGSAGYGTYLAGQGSCVPGVTDTICTLSGSYTGETPAFSSGIYALLTSYANSEGGLPAISSDPVASPDGGNYFNMVQPFASDVNMSLLLSDISGNFTIPLIVNGNFLGYNFFISPVNSVCSGLPAGVPCTQGNVGLYTGTTIVSPVTVAAIFDSSLAFVTPSGGPAPVPEPEWLALAGLIPGALGMLRRRFRAAV